MELIIGRRFSGLRNSMGNFHIKEFNGFKKPMPDINDPEVKERVTAISWKSYRTMAKKCIKGLSPKLGIPQFKINEMLNSEDYLTDVIFRLAAADWSYDKSRKRSPRSWRNQQVIYYLQSLPGVSKTRKNKQHASLDKDIGNSLDGETVSLYDFKDSLAIDPFDMVNGVDRKNRVRTYVHLLLRNTNLSDQQRQVINLRYFGGPDAQGIESMQKIGEIMGGITRQAVNQLWNRAIEKLRQTALGTTS